VLPVAAPDKQADDAFVDRCCFIHFTISSCA
jgi:hypothetical protein